jgi:hypothetical protein
MKSLTPVKSISNLSDEDTVRTDLSSLSGDSSSDEGRVSFGSIQVREYERIIGDHPQTKVGVPLSLGWGYYERDSVPIDKYESERVSKKTLRMSSITRKNILHNVYGIPEGELRAAEKEVRIINARNQKHAREKELKNKTTSKLKKIGKKFRKVFNAENFIKGLAAASPNTVMLSMSA